MFDFVQAKAKARRAVHAAFAVPAFYLDDSINAPVELRCRWHNKLQIPMGDLDGEGFSQIIEGIDQIVFQREVNDEETLEVVRDVDGNQVTLKRGGRLTFPSLLNVSFQLNFMKPDTGPVEEVWAVTRT